MTVDQTPTHPAASPRKLQFSLRSLIVLMVIVAVAFGFLVFYRRHTVTVNYRVAVVDSNAVNCILSAHAATSVADSPYAWLIVDDRDLATLMQRGGKPIPLLGKRSRTVSDWPRVAESFTYSQPRTLLLDLETNHKHTGWESGTLGGFLGSRQAGSQVQLRIEFDATFQRPDEGSLPGFDYSHQECRGKIFYEGEVPRGHLVFLAPVGEDSFHAVIFEVQ